MVIWPHTTGFAQSNYERDLWAADKIKGEQLAKKISTIEVMAPLAPVALSPFFGITCLSGTSMLCSRGVLPENDFLMGNKALDNGLVFIVFLALSVATSLPKMTAVSKGFAEVSDQLETYAGIISYLAIFYLAGTGQDSTTPQVVYTAGIFTFTWNTLLMIAVVINIIVINTVKYFFELLVWISPIPMLDAIFETANKVVTAALVAVYVFSPYLAMLLNIILFLMCFSIFNWVRRRVKYYRTIFIGPIVAKLLGRTGSSPSSQIKARIAAAVEKGETLLKVFPLRKMGRIKKKEMSYLTIGKNGLFLVKLRLIRQPKVEKLDTANMQIEVVTGLLSNTIEIMTQGTAKPDRLAFSKIHNNQIDSIAASLRPFGEVRTKSAADGAEPFGLAVT